MIIEENANMDNIQTVLEESERQRKTAAERLLKHEKRRKRFVLIMEVVFAFGIVACVGMIAANLIFGAAG